MEVQVNGKRLLITPAAFEDAMELQDAVGNALKGAKLDLKGLDNVDASKLLETDVSTLSGPLESIIGMALSVVTSKPVRAALFKCCEKAVYGEDRVTREFFEAEANRELYYPIMVEVVKVNLGPFFRKVSSLFMGHGGMLQRFLASKSN